MDVAITDRAACSVLPRSHPELLPGTAAHAWTYLLLEHPAPWPRRAEDVELPAAARRSLEALLTELPRARLQLIRRSWAPVERPLVALADVRPGLQRLHGIRLDRLASLAEVTAADLLAVPDGGAPSALTLVCTHGVRDPCCARYGLAVLRALRSAGEDVWECSHTGGHRFAANAVLLPEGLVYGNLDATSALAAVAARRAGRLLVDHCRGLSALEPPAQAADTLMRRRLGIDDLDGLRTLAVTATGEAGWQVTVEGRAGCLRVRVELQDTGLRGIESCRQAEPRPLPVYRLAAVEPVRPWG